MPKTKKNIRPKRATPVNTASSNDSGSRPQSKWRSLVVPFVSIRRWVRNQQSHSPHRSFRRTRRRDYARPLHLPGYWRFSAEVSRTMWQHKGTFGLLVGTYALFSGLMVGLASQSTYTQLAGLLRSTGGDIFKGNLGQLGEAGLLVMAGLSGGLNPNITEAQQLLAGLLVLMAWLTTVWLLRAYLAGKRPGLRDGLYNSGAPVVPTFLVSLWLIVQLIPIAIVIIGVSAALPTGLLSEGVEAMLFWAVAFLLVLLSLYWITSTFIALIIVTLPGMYPMQAMKAARDLVLGRRFPIVLRIVWLFIVSFIFYACIIIPLILFDMWLKGLLPSISWLPIVPIGLLIVSSLTVVWMAGYIYLLYRKVVDSDTEQA